LFSVPILNPGQKNLAAVVYYLRNDPFLLLPDWRNRITVSPSHGETIILFFQSGRNKNLVFPVREKQESCFSSQGETRIGHFSSSKDQLMS
jgi:hypothetical protein